MTSTTHLYFTQILPREHRTHPLFHTNQNILETHPYCLEARPNLIEYPF